MNEARQHRFALPQGAADLLLNGHGETQAARRGEDFPLIDGQRNPALRPEGHAQAAAIAERLQTKPIGAIYGTTMQRTHQTAAPLAAYLGFDGSISRLVVHSEWMILRGCQ